MAEKSTKPAADMVYTIDELAEGSSVFGVHRDVVYTALKRANVTEATEAEAKKIIENYTKKEV